MNLKIFQISPVHDSIWLKLIALGAYMVCLISSGILLAFKTYEEKYHGNFRTVINQLLSQLYGLVTSLYYFDKKMYQFQIYSIVVLG